ncbi:MAG: tol-pal system protein YbgF [Gallionella sp.]
MLKLRVLMLLGLSFVLPAQAGLFSDDDARKQIQQVEARVLKLEAQEARLLKLEEQDQRQTQSIFDLQGQIDGLNGELRKLRGQNEELAHGLQDAGKREKDFYVDLDTRLRHFESAEAAAVAKAAEVPAVPNSTEAPASDMAGDFAVENRAIEAAYGSFKAGNHAEAVKGLQDFIKKYPASVHLPNANYWLANAQFALNDFKSALATYHLIINAGLSAAKEPDALLNLARCQHELKAVLAESKTLKQLIAKYPDSAAAAKAKKLLTPAK